MTIHPSVLPAVLIADVVLACAAPNPGDPRVESGVVAVEGGETYYEVAGSGDAIVLVHGGFGDRRMWDDQFLALAADHRVVRYDLRGFGRSGAPEAAYSPVEDLRLLLDELGIERATLVGNSMGGALSIDCTLVHPERGDALDANGVASSDGVRCASGQIIRFGGHFAGTNGAEIGVWRYPNDVQTTPVSTATAQGAAQNAYYQLFYRNAAANFCNSSTANLSNGVQLVWP